jgi:hypothetical protein
MLSVDQNHLVRISQERQIALYQERIHRIVLVGRLHRDYARALVLLEPELCCQMFESFCSKREKIKIRQISGESSHRVNSQFLSKLVGHFKVEVLVLTLVLSLTIPKVLIIAIVCHC